MNAQVAPTAEVLPPVDSPVAEFNETAAGLAELRAQITSRTYNCATAEGDKIAREDRRLCVRLRVAIKERHGELKAPVIERGKILDTEKNRITAIIEALEAIPDKAIKAQEAIDDAKRAERQRAEAERQAKIDREIGRIANLPVQHVSASAASLRGVIEALEANALDGMEGISLIRATEAKSVALESLQGLLQARIQADADAAELARQREEAQARQAEEREAIRVENERAAAQRAEDDRVARENRERLQREDDERRNEQRRAEQAEADRQAAERAQAQRVEDEKRAEQLRQDEEARQEIRREQLKQEEHAKADMAKREQDAIDKATLVDSASAAVELLRETGWADHIVTRKLAAALTREKAKGAPAPAAKPTSKPAAKKVAKKAPAKKASKAGAP